MTGITRTGMDNSAPMGKATTTVLVHEWVTGGGLAGRPLPASWAAEGHAMRRAIAADFAAVPSVRGQATIDAGFPDEPGLGWCGRIGPGEAAATFAKLVRDHDY